MAGKENISFDDIENEVVADTDRREKPGENDSNVTKKVAIWTGKKNKTQLSIDAKANIVFLGNIYIPNNDFK